MRTSNIVQKSQSSREVSENAVAMSIDEASSVFLMDALGKLYSRPAQAVLREYLSNAVDAHKAKGGKLPAIQITLPENVRHAGSKKLSIRDFGKGMNEEEFSTILSRYGASTKRDSNAMIGGFGLGAKSGFAVSDEFFMTSYQSGRGLRVRIFKDNLNQGYIDVVNRFSTKEPDGMLVEVSIPDGNVAELSKKALYTDFPFFMGYGVDAIDVRPLIDHASQSVHNPKAFTELSVGANTVGWMSTSSSPAVMYGLVGKVAYKIDMAHLASLSRSNKLDKDLAAVIPILNTFKRTHVIDIPIGSVDMPSAREEIIYSERSLKTLGAIICNYALLMKQSLQKQLNLKKTKLQVIKFLADLEGDGYKDAKDLTWKGYSFTSDFFKKSELSTSTYKVGTYGADAVVHETSSNIRGFRSFRHLLDKTENGYGVYRISVDAKAEIQGVRKLLNDRIIAKFLNKKDVSSYGSYRQAVFIVIPTGDPLEEWIANATAIDVEEFKAIIAEEQREKDEAAAIAKAKKEKQEVARKKAAEAKMARAQFMLSNFIINSGNSKSLSRNTVEHVFKDSKVKKYYWSEAEVINHVKVAKSYKDKYGRTIKGSIHFPFNAREIPNTFSVIMDGSSYSNYSVSYLARLRAFLRMFLAEGSKVIVLAKDFDLESFKKEYPDVESAVVLVKESIEAQVQDSTSEIMVAYNAIGGVNYRDRDEIRNLTKFMGSLTKQQASMVSEDITSAVERFQIVLSSAEAGGRGSGLDNNYLMAMLKGFVPAESFEKNSYSVVEDITVLGAKYPLLMKGSFDNYSQDIVSHLIDYVTACNAN